MDRSTNIGKKIFLRQAIGFLCLIPLSSLAQFRIVQDNVILPSLTKKFHGLSGIEFIPKTSEWIIVNDRGHYFKFKDCKKIADFKKENLIESIQTDYFFESVRYDSTHDAYFFSVETDTYSAVYYSMGQLHTPNAHLILKIPLPTKNKGIEGIALSPTGSLWIAPEAGWDGEVNTSDNTHFYKYKNPLVENDTKQPERFSYKRTKFPGARFDEDKLGGISEILSIDETHLLILERSYYTEPKEEVIATLKRVKADTAKMELVIEDQYTFDFKNVSGLCNIEGMTWGDKEKKILFIVGDDGLGDEYFNDKIDPETGKYKKPTLRNQMILLRTK